MNARTLVLAVLAAALVVPGLAARADAFPVCVGTQGSGPGVPQITLTLEASSAGAFFQLTGQVVFAQAVSPPASLVTYAVSGTAIPNPDGFFVSLVGTGHDLAQNVFIGMLGLQLSADPAKNTLTYAKQSLDASATQIVIRVPVVQACAEP